MKENLYKKILAIEDDISKIHYYILLGLNLFEDNPQKIHEASLICIKKLREWQLHPDPDIALFIQDMLNQVSRASTTLEVSQKKQQYDKQLAESLGIATPAPKLRLPKSQSQISLKTCPSCGSQASSIAVICMECGYNFDTKQKLETVYQKPSAMEVFVERVAPVQNIISKWLSLILFPFAWIISFVIKYFYLIIIIVLILGLSKFYPQIKAFLHGPPPKPAPPLILSGKVSPYLRYYLNECEKITNQNSLWNRIYDECKSDKNKKAPYFKISLIELKKSSMQYRLSVMTSSSSTIYSEDIALKTQDPEMEWTRKADAAINTAALEYIKNNYKAFPDIVEQFIKSAADSKQNQASRIKYIRILASFPSINLKIKQAMLRLAENENEEKSIRELATSTFRAIESRELN